jgi:hypothetical protein
VPCNVDVRNKRQGWWSASKTVKIRMCDCALHAMAGWRMPTKKITQKQKSEGHGLLHALTRMLNLGCTLNIFV